MLKLLAIVGFCFSLQAFAQDVIPEIEAGCPADTIPGRTQFSRPQIDDGGQTYVACDDKNMPYRVRSALWSLKQITKRSSFNDDTGFGPSIMHHDLFQFVRDRVDKIVLSQNDDSVCEGVVGAHFVNEDGIATAYLCPILNQQTELVFVQTLLHEARHAEGHIHVKCSRLPMSTTENLACDDAFEDLGAYAVTAEFLIGVSRDYKMKAQAYRQEARSEAILHLTQRFNKLPANLIEGVALGRASANDVLFYDGHATTPILADIPPGFKLTAANTALTFDDAQAERESEYDFHHQFEPSKPNRFLNTTRLEDTAIDMAKFGELTCYLYTEHVLCFRLNFIDDPYYAHLGGPHADHFMLVNQKYLRPSMPSKMLGFIINVDGSNWALPPMMDELKQNQWNHIDRDVEVISATLDAVADAPPASKIRGKTLGLYGKNGTVLLMPKDFATSKTQRYMDDAPGISKDVPVTKMVSPFIWSERLETL